jgi:hypothetical protein
MADSDGRNLGIKITNLPLDTTSRDVADAIWAQIGVFVQPGKVYIQNHDEGFASALIVIRDEDFVAFMNRHFASNTDGADGGPVVFVPRGATVRLKVTSITFELPDGQPVQETEQVGVNRHGLPILK